ncbi:MAG: MFS transporter, partial [Oscillospiraceae bacterium]|nr:MFS transporter [Oscillospiraceae bacterium]
LTRKESLKFLPFWLSWIVCLCYSYSCSIPGYIANCATMELGQTIQFGATASMFYNLGCIVASVATGHINDRFGVKAGMGWGALFNVIGYGTILLGFHTPNLLLPGAFLVGVGGSMYTVQAPLLAKSVIGEKHYSDVWSMMMVANSLIGGGFAFTIGWFYDFGHTYRGAFILGPVLYIIALVLGIVAMNISEKRQIQEA